MLTPEILEFTVELDKGSSGAVGWISLQDKGEDIEMSSTFTSVLSNSLFLNIAERTIFGPNEILEQLASLFLWVL